jgi:hypothetical protein
MRSIQVIMSLSLKAKNGSNIFMNMKNILSSQIIEVIASGHNKLPNKCQQADLGKLSPFLQKDAKTPPSHPSRCGRR